jgi:hypothetical protein
VLGLVLLLIPGRWAEARLSPPVVTPHFAPPPPPPELVDPLLAAIPSVTEAERLFWKPGPDFYYAIWRDDLAASYRLRSGLKLTSRILGATALMAGSLVSLAAGFGCDPLLGPPNAPGCYNQRWGDIGGLIMLGGLIALIGPSFIDTDPVSPQERLELLGEFARREGEKHLSFAPRVDRDGASLSLSFRF